MEQCIPTPHEYNKIGEPYTNKDGALVQIIYCIKCADRKEIIIADKT